MHNSTVMCTVSLEELSPSGGIVKKSLHKNMTIILGRDEFQEMQLRLELPKKVTNLSVREVVIYKKFLKDGKATISLPDQHLQLMLSNCPPDKLAIFIKTMQAKLEVLRQKGFIHQRQRLLSEVPRAFNEISPLTIKDLQVAQNAASVTGNSNTKTLVCTEKPSASMNVPAGPGAMKRKLVNCDSKENKPAVSAMHDDMLKKKLKVSNGMCLPMPLAKQTTLNREQRSVLEAVLRGSSIFFTGSAGTGKSFLMKRILGALPPHHTFATASTGVAACHIGGITLHSFAGIGSGTNDLTQCIQLASRQQVATQWRRCNHLIIDEISMVDGDYFEKLEAIARAIRKSDEPFGGIQLIVSGDFLQLPPVAKGNKPRFCFQTSAWYKSIKVTMELKEVQRQSDSLFIQILHEIRLGRCPKFVEDTLRETQHNAIEYDGVLATQLCTHKEDVEQINQFKLKELKGDCRTFAATDTDPVYTQSLDKLCPAQSNLQLKIGAQVLLCKNLDVQRGLVNGARGIVTGFEPGMEGFPVVKFMCGPQETIKPVKWIFKIGGGVMLSRKQVPLKLAWAISIHKSQGMTLDCVEISLSKVFESGQSYVALSRAKSLPGLRVLNFDASCVRANPDVLQFYSKLRLSQKIMETSSVQSQQQSSVKYR